MTIGLLRRTLPALALLLAILAPCVHAQNQRSTGEPQGLAPRSTADRRISLAQAVAQVQRETGGRVLDARDLGNQYRIKVLTRSGEVRVVYVDARTGETR
jgi:uncharacterized membrane protein YkoI